MQALKYRVALSLIPNLGTVRFRVLEAHFGDLENAWIAGFVELKAAALDDRTARSIVSHRGSISPDDQMDKLQRCGARAFNWHDPEYPPMLLEIPDPPPVLHLRGNLATQDQRSVAIVGTHKATAYGREVAATLSRDLAASSVTIVSGLARGIDSIADRAALDAGGRTIAVFGTGVDTIYSSEHAKLAQDIAGQRCVDKRISLGDVTQSPVFPWAPW